jgi:hypothetical protein
VFYVVIEGMIEWNARRRARKTDANQSEGVVETR